MIATDRIAKIEAKIEEAAKHLNPILLDGDPDTARAAHDALNALSVARIQVELLKEDL